MKFDKLKVGMVIYDVHSCKMGNTNMRSIGVWTVLVKEIDTEKRQALCSWNTNPAKWYNEFQIGKLKEKEPLLIRTAFGGRRRPTKEEKAELIAKSKGAA